MEQRAAKVMDNQVLAAWARLSAAIGPTLALAIMGWLANTIVQGQRDAAIQAAEQAKLVAQVAELDKYKMEAFGRGQAFLARLEAMSKTLERLEQRLDKK